MQQQASGTGRSMGDRIIRSGAIAAAIVTILGLARLLWPDPTPRLAGELADVSIVTKLFTAGKGAMVPQDWLVNRRALVAIPEATVDRASGEFWIPLPNKRGPY
ncbi:MAG: hypothetical protein ACRDJL_05885, partial [Actinomycetota bacterium]